MPDRLDSWTTGLGLTRPLKVSIIWPTYDKGKVHNVAAACTVNEHCCTLSIDTGTYEGPNLGPQIPDRLDSWTTELGLKGPLTISLIWPTSDTGKVNIAAAVWPVSKP